MSKHYFEGDNMNDLYTDIIVSLTQTPQYKVSPRGMDIKETTGAVMKLTDASKCNITLKGRKMNYAFGIIEKMEYLTGQTDPDRLVFYNSNFENYRSEYGVFDGAYPERLGYWYRYIYNLLKSDPDTRQAVMTIYGVQDRHKSKDIPCTLSFQFFIREGKLNMIANMRSNDVLWGLPYDTAGFCFIQEALAACLGVEIGTYELHVGSLHIYTERQDQLTSLLVDSEELELEFPRIPKYDSLDDLHNDLRLFWVAERALRVKGEWDEASVMAMPAWLAEYYYIVKNFVVKKNNKTLPV